MTDAALPVPTLARRTWWLLLLAALALYLAVIPLSNGDVRNFLLPWTGYILAHGRIAALGDAFSEYAPPYLYLLSAGTLLDGLVAHIAIVKLVSIAGTLFLAGAFRALLGRFVPPPAAWSGAALLLFVPTVAINGPVWGQCDALYAGCLLLFLWAAMAERPAVAMALLGLAVSFKLQAVFVAPVVLALLLAGRVRLHLLALAPAAYAAAMVPAWLAGRPARELALVYVAQGSYFHDLARSVPNIWQILRALVFIPYEAGVIAGLIVTAAAVIALAWARRNRVANPHDLLLTALAAAVIVPYLLPKMHNRYFFLADVLAFAHALVRPSRRATWIAALVQVASLLSYSVFLLRIPGGAFVGAFAMTAALVLILRELRDDRAAA